MASAFYHSLVLFFGAVFLFSDGSLSNNGQELTGLTMYVLDVVDFVDCLNSHSRHLL